MRRRILVPVLSAFLLSPIHALCFAAKDEWDRGATIRTGHGFYVRSVAFCPDGKLLATAGFDGRIRLWDVESRRVRRVIDVEPWLALLPLAFSPNGKLLASGTRDGMVMTSDVSNGRHVGTFKTDRSRVTSVAFTSDGTLLASAGFDGKIVLWDLATGREKKSVVTHPGVLAIALSSRAGVLAAAFNGMPVAIWSTATYVKEELTQPDTSTVVHLAFSPDGALLAMVSADRPIIVWSIERRKVQLKLDPNTARPGPDHKGIMAPTWDTCVAFSPDGGLLAFGDLSGDVHIWGVSKGELVGTLAHAPDAGPTDEALPGVLCLAFSPDGNILACACSDENVTLWIRKRMSR